MKNLPIQVITTLARSNLAVLPRMTNKKPLVTAASKIKCQLYNYVTKTTTASPGN